MSNNSETTDPTRTGNVGPTFIQGSGTGANFTPGPMEGEASRDDAGDPSASGKGIAGAARPDATIGKTDDYAEDDEEGAGSQGATGNTDGTGRLTP